MKLKHLIIIGLLILVFAGCKDKEQDEAVLFVDQPELFFSAAGDSKTIFVTSNIAWEATVQQNVNWVSVAPVSGKNDTLFTITVGENTSTTETRTATVTLSGSGKTANINIMQANKAAIAATPTELVFEAAAASKELALFANKAWTATVDQKGDWLSINKTSGSESATITVSATGNTATEAREAAILFTIEGEAETIKVKVTQKGALPQSTIQVFDQILFYDGYESTVDKPLPDGVIRHKNSLYATKLSAEQLALFGQSLTMKVVIKAACDNYDRIGSVNLAFVPKGNATYQPQDVKRIELGRFITPFMNKNYKPDTVPYFFSINYLSSIFKDQTLLATYDYWVELDVFGVPYAAQKEVTGCSGRNDVFYGSLYFMTSIPPAAAENNNLIIPLFFQQTFNNYQANATDELGKTLKTVTFTLDKAVKDAKLVLVTSNHGANQGGEEYIRRMHYVYFDNGNVLTYKPGRTSCEPFRVYNTQANGIYGYTKKSDAAWQSFSNWCPGDVIDNRVIDLGTVGAGAHTFKIEVPDATFVGKEGNFPMSLFFIGKAE